MIHIYICNLRVGLKIYHVFHRRVQQVISTKLVQSNSQAKSLRTRSYNKTNIWIVNILSMGLVLERTDILLNFCTLPGGWQRRLRSTDEKSLLRIACLTFPTLKSARTNSFWALLTPKTASCSWLVAAKSAWCAICWSASAPASKFLAVSSLPIKIYVWSVCHSVA